ncbi:MAG: class I SAM-dependent methyltransferase [Leptolyngbyaceae cyanobacterium SM1_3_5]|nr:class I SAM-dependent methyltransferase [Leptolyngbyaceae cyanobacterium SM1_3_5]
MTNNLLKINWQHWLERWDAQQSGYLPYREERFQVMLDTIAYLLPKSFTAIDLACGPGAISQRLLNRFPQANCIAIDYDPVLLAIGQGVLGTMGDRLRWIEADLTQDDWLEQLGEIQVDAVLTTTALHWLPIDRLVHLYQKLGQIIRPGGVFLNGDHLYFPSHLGMFQRLAKAVQTQQKEQAFSVGNQEDWEHWWEAIEQEAELKELLAERHRRFQPRFTENEPTLAIHEAALREAGFREVSTIWQRFDDRILLAVR